MFFDILQAVLTHDDAKTWLKFMDSSSFAKQLLIVICKGSAGAVSGMVFHVVYFARTADQFMIAHTSRDYFHRINILGFITVDDIKQGLRLARNFVGVEISCFSPREAKIDLISLWSDGTR